MRGGRDRAFGGGIIPSSDLSRLDALLAVVPGPGLLFGLLLLCAILGGYLAHALLVPRVIGYILAGSLVHFFLYWALGLQPHTEQAAAFEAAGAPLRPIKDLGLGLILFSIGGVFETRRFVGSGGRILRIAACDMSITFILVALGIASSLIIAGEAGETGILVAFVVLLAIAAMETAPATTLFVLREYDAKGPTSDAILTITGINNIGCVVGFHVAFSLLIFFGMIHSGQLTPAGTAWHLVFTVLGSPLLGIVLGFVFSILHAKLTPPDTVLLLIAAMIVLGSAEGWLLENQKASHNFLITAIFMGASFANMAVDPDRLGATLRLVTAPVLVGFFAIAGFKLHLSDLKELHLVGAAYILFRLAGKVLGARTGARWAKLDDVHPNVGHSLLAQATIAIGLADFAASHWTSDWARRFSTVLLGSIVVFEIIGPLLTKRVLKQAGEVKAITLLRRHTTAPGATSTLATTWGALLRAIGLESAPKQVGKGELLVRHVMRANVRTIPASADFTEVLHHVEQSRFNHFPVTDDEGRLAGVIHFADLDGVIYDPLLSKLITAVDVADQATPAVPADMPLGQLLAIFKKGDYGSLPVVDASESRKVIGIVERRDALRAFHVAQTKQVEENP